MTCNNDLFPWSRNTNYWLERKTTKQTAEQKKKTTRSIRKRKKRGKPQGPLKKKIMKFSIHVTLFIFFTLLSFRNQNWERKQRLINRKPKLVTVPVDNQNQNTKSMILKEIKKAVVLIFYGCRSLSCQFP